MQATDFCFLSFCNTSVTFQRGTFLPRGVFLSDSGLSHSGAMVPMLNPFHLFRLASSLDYQTGITTPHFVAPYTNATAPFCRCF
jgi:hypothetical protein